MWKAIGEVFERSQYLFTRLGGFEIFWASAIAFFNTLNKQIESPIRTSNENSWANAKLPLFWSPTLRCSIWFHAKPYISVWLHLWLDALHRSVHLYRFESFSRTYLSAISVSPWPSTVPPPNKFAHRFYSPWRTVDRNRSEDLPVADTLKINALKIIYAFSSFIHYFVWFVTYIRRHHWSPGLCTRAQMVAEHPSLEPTVWT